MVCRSEVEAHDTTPQGMADRREAMPYVVGQDVCEEFPEEGKRQMALGVI